MTEINKKDTIGMHFDIETFDRHMQLKGLERTSMLEQIKGLPTAYGPMIDAMIKGDSKVLNVMEQELDLGDENARGFAEYYANDPFNQFEKFLTSCISGELEPKNPEASVRRFNIAHRPEIAAEEILNSAKEFIETKMQENRVRDQEISAKNAAMKASIDRKRTELKKDRMGTRNPFKRWALRRDALKNFKRAQEYEFARFKSERDQASDRNSREYIQPYHEAKMKMQKGEFDWIASMDEKVAKWKVEQSISEINKTPTVKYRSLETEIKSELQSNRQVQGSARDRGQEKSLDIPQKKQPEISELQ